MDRRMPFEVVEKDGLLWIVVTGVIRLEDTPVLQDGVTAYQKAHPDQPARIICDCTQFKVYAPDAAEVLLQFMKRDNARIEKAAFVVGEGTGALQLSRMIRDAGSERRQLFQDLNAALAWLRQ
jgi:hypothetical protein